MTILGIDPGIGRTGWGVIEKKSAKITLVDFGCVETTPNSLSAERLSILFESVNKIIDKYQPDKAGVETLIFNTNTKTAMAVGQARGVIILALALKKIDVQEFTPLQVKQAVSGYGRAEKFQVQKMVKALLNLKEIPKPDDAADALAVALTTSVLGVAPPRKLFQR